jgi:hypothetical protein
MKNRSLVDGRWSLVVREQLPSAAAPFIERKLIERKLTNDQPLATIDRTYD